jgi:hypothetical protein
MRCHRYRNVSKRARNLIPRANSARQTPRFHARHLFPCSSSNGNIDALAKVVFYCGYPLVDVFGRTSPRQVINELGVLARLVPASPMHKMGFIDDYLARTQRLVVTPNNDTI